MVRVSIYTGPCDVKRTADQIKSCCGFPMSEGTERVYVEVGFAADNYAARKAIQGAVRAKFGDDHWLVRELDRH